MKTNHKYRVSIYLGKEMYEEFDKISKFMGISINTLSKIILTTGYELSKSLDKDLKEGVLKPTGEKQSKE